MLDLAKHVVEQMSGHFEPGKFEDRHKNASTNPRVEEQSNRPITSKKGGNVINLKDALEKSVAKNNAKERLAAAKRPSESIPCLRTKSSATEETHGLAASAPVGHLVRGRLPIRNGSCERLSSPRIVRSCIMRGSPSIVPDAENRKIYLVLDDFVGHIGRSWREVDEARADRESMITDLLEGQYFNPVRVVAFNTAEGWSRDTSNEIADELAQRIANENRDIPLALEGFIDRHGSGRPVQLPLPLRGLA
jgi:hypothetical protein